MKFTEATIECSNLPRKTLDFLSKLKDQYTFHAGLQIEMAHLAQAHERKHNTAKHIRGIEDIALSRFKTIVETYNDMARDWKGARRNTPVLLICGSGSNHFWVSKSDTKERVFIVRYES